MSENGGFLKRFFGSRTVAERVAAKEERFLKGQTYNQWGIYDTPVSGYEDEFKEILGENFGQFLTERLKTRSNIFALDVMGTANFSRNYRLDGEVNVTLVDNRTEEDKIVDLTKNRVVIGGDVLKGSTWKAVQDFIKQNDSEKEKGFDLAVCRPIFGWHVVMDKDIHGNYGRKIEQILIDKMVSCLHSNGGTLVAIMALEGYDYRDWFNLLNSTNGISASGNEATVKITRTQKTIGKIPSIPPPKRL